MRKSIWVNVSVEGKDRPCKCRFSFDDQTPIPMCMDEADARVMNRDLSNRVWRVGELRIRHTSKAPTFVTLWPKPGTPWQDQLPEWGWVEPERQPSE